MKKILLAGACALALSATGALAQTNEGAAPSAKSGGTMSPSGERHMKKEHTGKTTGARCISQAPSRKRVVKGRMKAAAAASN